MDFDNLLDTHTIFIDKYPGGRSTLETSIRGGELFQTIVFNRVISVFSIMERL